MILQSDHQVKYEGSKIWGRHIIRYGFDFNRIVGAGYVPLGILAPNLVTNVGPSEEAFAQTGPFPGGDTNPLNYPVESVGVSNGLGYLTPTPGLGLPAGAFPYRRLAAYFGASSKWKRNLTLTYGLRYVRETGRSDNGFPAIPQLNALMPGLGNRVRQPNLNFAPQLGFAWDPTGKAKTSIRGGIGLFYENVLAVAGSSDPALRTQTGDVFFQSPTACNGTAQPVAVPIPGGTLDPTPLCSKPDGSPIAIGAAASQMAAFQKLYQANSPFNLNVPNPNYLGALLKQGLGSFGAVYDPDFRTPRSIQMNIGVQREIRPGIIFGADFVRNVQTHYFLSIDENHAGDIHYFNKAAAQAAISATLVQCGVTSIQNGINAPCPSGVFLDANQNPRHLLMSDFASKGLTSSADFNAVCSFPSSTAPGSRLRIPRHQS